MSILLSVYLGLAIVGFMIGVFEAASDLGYRDSPSLTVGMFFVPTFFVGYYLVKLLTLPIGRKRV